MINNIEYIQTLSQAFLKEAKDRNEYFREYMRKRKERVTEEIHTSLGNKCSSCGDKSGPFHIDHIDYSKKKRRAADLHSVNDKDFKTELKNLQLLCLPCHKDKTKLDKQDMYKKRKCD